jgi:hypothetical protein
MCCYTIGRMRLEIEVWLRGNDFATTDVVDVPLGPARGWSDHDVRELLKALLRSLDRASNPDADPDRAVALRGFSWIVSPFDEGFTVAVEIQLGAAAAGPFDVDQAELEATITRVVAADRRPATGVPTVH